MFKIPTCTKGLSWHSVPREPQACSHTEQLHSVPSLPILALMPPSHRIQVSDFSGPFTSPCIS